MKNAIDRWIPNILPFFITKKNGATSHPQRYETNPRLVMIGYGDGLTAEDKRLFLDITDNHRENGEVLFYEGDCAEVCAALSAVSLERTEEVL